jgi:hypothetical protein
MQEIWKQVHSNIEQAQQQQKKYADQRRRPVEVYSEGDLVLLSTKHLNLPT